MVHMSYVPARDRSPESTRTYHATTNCHGPVPIGAAAGDPEEGAHVGTRGRGGIPKTLRRRRDDEHGAEMVEFAIVVVLLIALLYGIITLRPDPGRPGHDHAGGGRCGPVRHRLIDDRHRHRRGPGRHRRRLDEQRDLRHLGHHHHVRRDRAALPVERQQHLPEGHGDLQLQLDPRCSPRCQASASSRRRLFRRPTSSNSRPRARR